MSKFERKTNRYNHYLHIIQVICTQVCCKVTLFFYLSNLYYFIGDETTYGSLESQNTK